ncbi:MAG TPA: ABC transporter ATP-binding protein [Methanomassiliicoccales archaeon]|nr:ABC transporter ATP-binding protein [Methanomassiliicoccales archaeon]
MDAYVLKDVSFRYEDGRVALEHIDLTIREGEKVAIVGSNGAGKSTLLQILAALHPPSEGEIRIKGETVTRRSASELRRHVGLLFQDPDDQLFMPTVREDVAFGPSNLGLREEEVRSRVEQAMAATSMHEYGERVPHNLSLGEKKRAAIAGLIAMSPSILLLDEPTANLDPRGRRGLIDLLRSRSETVIMATHDLEVAFELVDRIVVLNRSVLFDGALRALLEEDAVLSMSGLELPSFCRLIRDWSLASGSERRTPTTTAEALRMLLDCKRSRAPM